jgi:iron complex outermembrane receptor protein
MHSMLGRNRLLTTTAVPFLVLALATQAHAQSGAPASGTNMNPPSTVESGTVTPTPREDAQSQLQDIVVTARRTSEALQTTPVAVTALNEELLLQRQVTNVTDLARAVPSLSIGTGGTGPASIVYLAIRGQAQNSPNSFSDPAVGIYIDGVYVARAIVGNLGFLDPGSAEVLRGPQGTLFGRNTTGGALNLTTARPTDNFEGYFKVGYGNYSQKVVEGVVNIPLSDEVSTRFAGRYNERNGYYPNQFQPAQGAIKGEYYGRGSLRWESKALPIKLDVTGDYTHYVDTGNATAVAAINPAGPLAAFYGLSAAGVPGFTSFNHSGLGGPIEQYLNPEFATGAQKAVLLSQDWRRNYQNPATGYDFIDRLKNYNQAGSGTANLAVDLGDVTVKSITGYRKSRSTSNLDLLGIPTGAGAFISQYKQHQFSEELQLSGDSGNLQWVAGAMYFREAGNEYSKSAIFYATPFAGYAEANGDFVSTSQGLFAQANYNFTSALRVTGGIRYTWDKREINRHGTNNWNTPDPICAVGPNSGAALSTLPNGCNDKNTAKFRYPAWTAGVDYKLDDDIFVYLKTSGASNSGGFNSRPVPPPYSSAFSPEKVRDVEGGFKGEFLNHRVRTNIAIFHAWQSDVQRIINTTFVDAGGVTRLTQFVSNAGKAKTYGLEFEGTIIPWRGMDFSGSFAYLNAKYVKGSRNEVQLIPDATSPTGTRGVTVDRSGEPITQAPKWTASLSATQTIDMSAGKLRLHGDWAYVANRAFDAFTTGDPAQVAAVAAANRASIIKGYSLFNAQVSFTLDKPNLEFALWGKNLANQANFTNVFNSYTGLGAVVQFQGPPRTFGGTVAFRF